VLTAASHQIQNGSTTTIATQTFHYTFTQTINGIPAFCYPLTGAKAVGGKYYISESDTLNPYNSLTFDGPGTVVPGSNQVCFAAKSGRFTAVAGNSYTLTLYFDNGK